VTHVPNKAWTEVVKEGVGSHLKEASDRLFTLVGHSCNLFISMHASPILITRGDSIVEEKRNSTVRWWGEKSMQHTVLCGHAGVLLSDSNRRGLAV
jgi:hypothetical protein